MCFTVCTAAYNQENVTTSRFFWSSLEWRSPGLTPACLPACLPPTCSQHPRRQKTSLPRRNFERARLETLTAVVSCTRCPSGGSCWRIRGRRCLCPGEVPLDHRSGRNVSPPTTPDCLQLMTHSHHLMLRSRHVGKTYSLCHRCVITQGELFYWIDWI